MGRGILVCGLNGSGKSTFGKALAIKLGYHLIDMENLIFPKTDPDDIFASPCSKEEGKRRLLEEIKSHDRFVFVAVKGDYGEEIQSSYEWVVVLEVPREVRLQRVRDCAFQKFGKRMMPGGDLYEREEAFFKMVCSRKEDYVTEWVKTLDCPVLYVDGTLPISEMISYISEKMEETGEGQNYAGSKIL